MLTWEQFESAIQEADRRLSLIKAKYPEVMKPYLVICSGKWQAGISRRALDVLKECPALAVDGESKNRFMSILSAIKQARCERKWNTTVLEQDLNRTSGGISFIEDLTIEMRFGVLTKYVSIWQLQTDDLIDRDLTAQGKASIRIVVGTVKDLMVGQKLSSLPSEATNTGISESALSRGNPRQSLAVSPRPLRQWRCSMRTRRS